MAQSFTPFTENATEREADLLFLLLMVEGTDPHAPLTMNLDEYVEVMRILSMLYKNFDSVEECFTLELDNENEEITIRTSDALEQAGSELPNSQHNL